MGGPVEPRVRVQQLHLVGFTTDLDGLIFSARRGSKSGGYLVVLDDQLQRSIEEALRMRASLPPGERPASSAADRDADGDAEDMGEARVIRPRLSNRPESGLTPREMQARLRGGRTIAEVADEAGVDEEWVNRFAAPILAEQDRVVQRALLVHFTKPRVGESAQPLATAVRLNLLDRGVRLAPDEYDGGWSAWNLEGSAWVVRFAYLSRQRLQVAEWDFDVADGQLAARNRLASQLAFTEASRRRRPVSDLPEPAVTAPASPPARRRSGRRPAARPVRSARPASPARATAPTKKATAKKTTVKRAATTTGAGGPAPARRAAVKKAVPAKKAVAKRAGPAKKVAPARKAAAAKKAAPAKKAGPAKKTVATKAAPPKKAATKKAAAATKAGGAKRTGSAKKAAGRPRKAPAAPPAVAPPEPLTTPSEPLTTAPAGIAPASPAPAASILTSPPQWNGAAQPPSEPATGQDGSREPTAEANVDHDPDSAGIRRRLNLRRRPRGRTPDEGASGAQDTIAAAAAPAPPTSPAVPPMPAPSPVWATGTAEPPPALTIRADVAAAARPAPRPEPPEQPSRPVRTHERQRPLRAR